MKNRKVGVEICPNQICEANFWLRHNLDFLVEFQIVRGLWSFQAGGTKLERFLHSKEIIEFLVLD